MKLLYFDLHLTGLIRLIWLRGRAERSGMDGKVTSDVDIWRRGQILRTWVMQVHT